MVANPQALYDTETEDRYHVWLKRRDKHTLIIQAIPKQKNRIPNPAMPTPSITITSGYLEISDKEQTLETPISHIDTETLEQETLTEPEPETNQGEEEYPTAKKPWTCKACGQRAVYKNPANQTVQCHACGRIPLEQPTEPGELGEGIEGGGEDEYGETGEEGEDRDVELFE